MGGGGAAANRSQEADVHHDGADSTEDSEEESQEADGDEEAGNGELVAMETKLAGASQKVDAEAGT